MILDWQVIFEWVDVFFCLLVGIWSTLFAYGLVSNRICGKLRWNSGFRRHMRWLGPLLFVFTVLLISLSARLLRI